MMAFFEMQAAVSKAYLVVADDFAFAVVGVAFFE